MQGKRGQETELIARKMGPALGWNKARAGTVALEARDDAFRIYNGLPQKCAQDF